MAALLAQFRDIVNGHGIKRGGFCSALRCGGQCSVCSAAGRAEYIV